MSKAKHSYVGRVETILDAMYEDILAPREEIITKLGAVRDYAQALIDALESEPRPGDRRKYMVAGDDR